MRSFGASYKNQKAGKENLEKSKAATGGRG